jgi:hypothetical protein
MHGLNVILTCVSFNPRTDLIRVTLAFPNLNGLAAGHVLPRHALHHRPGDQREAAATHHPRQGVTHLLLRTSSSFPVQIAMAMAMLAAHGSVQSFRSTTPKESRFPEAAKRIYNPITQGLHLHPTTVSLYKAITNLQPGLFHVLADEVEPDHQERDALEQQEVQVHPLFRQQAPGGRGKQVLALVH